jgi:hypothetical protein
MSRIANSQSHQIAQEPQIKGYDTSLIQLNDLHLKYHIQKQMRNLLLFILASSLAILGPPATAVYSTRSGILEPTTTIPMAESVGNGAIVAEVMLDFPPLVFMYSEYRTIEATEANIQRESNSYSWIADCQCSCNQESWNTRTACFARGNQRGCHSVQRERSIRKL